MAYNNQNSGDKRDYSNDVNTNGVQFYNNKGIESTTLGLGFWNNFLSVQITPELEKSKQANGKMFDYTRTVKTSLGVDKIAMLLKKIVTDILPAIEKGEDKSIGVVAGVNNLIVVSTGKRKTGTIRPYIAIHKELNPDTKKPELSTYYEFNTTQNINDYDETTGSYTVEDTAQSELFAFIEVLKAAIIGLSNATAHSNAVVNRYNATRQNKYFGAICEKLGIETGSFTGGNKPYQRSNNVFDSNNSYTHKSNEYAGAEPTNLENIDDLNEFIQ